MRKNEEEPEAGHLIAADESQKQLKKKKKKKGRGKFIAELTGLILLMLISLALIFNKQIRDLAISLESARSAASMLNGSKSNDPTTSKQAKINRELNHLKEQYRKRKQDGDELGANDAKHKIHKLQPKGTTYNWKSVKPMSTEEALSQFNKKHAGAMGDVAIPHAGLYLPINAGVGNWALSCGFGTFSEMQQMGVGNYPLAAHNLSTTGKLGALLDKSRVGNLVYLTDLNKIYVYRIYHKQEFPPTATWVSDIHATHNGKPVAILLTCHDWGATREVVFSEFVRSYKADKYNLRIFKNLYKK